MALVGRQDDGVLGRQYGGFGGKPVSALRTQGGHSSAWHQAPQRFDGVAVEPKQSSLASVVGMLDRIGCGYLILNSDRKVMEWNSAAQNTLEREGEAADTAGKVSVALRRLIANVPGNFLPGTLSWVVIRGMGDRPLVLNEKGIATPDATSIVALLDRENRSGPNPQTLQRMFGLTSAETQLALRLAQGDAPLEIARKRRLSRTTIRSQLASLFAKTETRRQAELVALLGRICVLP
ncbi:MAG: helix-turn-helix transcriptional regulator [Mesorhizobium sp.]|uniref:helix-turn-helix transcriptional regulator n=1 Tax=unclassified Mesorhizobium TaxID=325217 RepID=UPI000FCA3B73|nr:MULTISPECIES: helix-turn-helix transcriptional regulator [unclassified Mesorhizobium]RUV22716.1 helix-turn-helix transcriptional regulator [Mesorhizobium sp. M7A.F.Ca.MR.245.00.0.0]RUV53366.1 helix-turn-helix transcriptional regulator [Mesorhizobium sp. M7A.F.Ca.MR.228.00.0.0]RWB08324.1 MAG: helix-turn-helix transcriptional regulator [Mesorhizobium sp.]RWB16003.1 MAG: helix-turn-helix transcriptional regulator [Mesorhizobium sp.]